MSIVKPVEKNKDYIVEIKGMGFQGEGVGKTEDNFPIFIEGAITGEKVKVKIVRVSKSFAFGKLLEVIEASPKREKPVCDIYKRCGGCQLQHLSYEGQLEFKKNRVEDCLSRIGKLKNVVIHDTLGMKTPFRYRNKVQLPVGKSSEVAKGSLGGNVEIGFYAQRSHDIIKMDCCHIQHEEADKVVELTKQWMNDHNIAPYNEETQEGIVRHIMIRKGFKTGQVMVVIVANTEELPHKEAFIDLITKNIQGIKSIVHNINKKKTNVVLDIACKTLWGEDKITDYIGDLKFSISPLSFFQVNPTQTEVLYGKTLEYADLHGDEVVFDAYCGTGTISLFLSQKAKKVYGVEIVPQAIENAKENAKENSITNAEFFVGEAETVIPDLISQGIKADVVVVDPPRKGCEKSLLEAIVAMAPTKIVYVSCDPSTLARDLGILEEMGNKTVTTNLNKTIQMCIVV